MVLTNCSNNYGPWQYPEKLIPVVILKAAAGEPIPLYGDGECARLAVCGRSRGSDAGSIARATWRQLRIGGSGERNNRQVVEAICTLMDQLRPQGAPHARLITLVSDRPGHDRRYSIDPTLIQDELRWRPRRTFEQGLESTVRWFLDNLDWCQVVQQSND